MKKIITLSVFTLGSMVSFAGNGEKDFALENFSALTAEKVLTKESQEFFNHTAYYDLTARVVTGTPTNSIIQLIPITETNCIDATQLASLITAYESVYAIMYPDASSVTVTATKIDDCAH